MVGVSLGTAWAHPSSGDTVASVMIGGLRTVQNGAFPVHTNDLICIYFDDERDLFEVGVSFFLHSFSFFSFLFLQENGGRIPRARLSDGQGNMDIEKVVEWVKHGKIEHMVQNNEPTGQAKLRKDYYERGNGNYPASLSMDGKHIGKIHVARSVCFSSH